MHQLRGEQERAEEVTPRAEAIPRRSAHVPAFTVTRRQRMASSRPACRISRPGPLSGHRHSGPRTAFL